MPINSQQNTSLLVGLVWSVSSLLIVCCTIMTLIGCSSPVENSTNAQQETSITTWPGQKRSSRKVATDEPVQIADESSSKDSTNLLLGEGLGIFDTMKDVLTEGDDLSIPTLIEGSADRVRAGLDVIDGALPSLEPEEASEIGGKFRDSLIARHGVITDKLSLDLVMPIWKEVTRASRQRPNSLKITLLDDSDINAFAFVGRNVVVNRGFIEYAKDCNHTKDMIRFVLGHEIGHVVLGHTDTPVRRHLAAESYLPGAGLATKLIEKIIKQTPFNQSQERAADCYSRELLMANNWSLVGGIEFFKNTHQRSDTSRSERVIESLFSSHPDSDRRIKLLESGSNCNDG